MRFRKAVFILGVFYGIPFIFMQASFAQKPVRLLTLGEIWHKEENDFSGGWERCWLWPGNRYLQGGPGVVKMVTANARNAGPGFGVRDWKDRRKRFHSYYICSANAGEFLHTTDASAEPYGNTFEKVLRVRPPDVYVDGHLQGPRHTYDRLDPTLPCDGIIHGKVNFPVGITADMTWLSYASSNAANYLILDVIFTNTGNANSTPKIELRNQTLHGVCWAYVPEPMVTSEGANQYKAVWENNNDDWVEYYGENYLDYLGSGDPLHPAGDPNADSLRLWILWDGDNNKIPGDDVGDPDLNPIYYEKTPGHGRLLSPAYVGWGILHADKSFDDKTNDLSQPFSTVWRPGTVRWGERDYDKLYKFLFSGTHMKSPQEMGYTEPNDAQHVAAPYAYLGVGPYEMPFGSSIHITMLVVINGLSREKCRDIGLSWYNAQHGGEGLTDEEKDALVATGRDSLMKYYSCATRRYFRNLAEGRNPFAVPRPPRAPDLWVEAGNKCVKLHWSDVSKEPDPDTGVPDFAGYRVYRSHSTGQPGESGNEGPYDLIWECGGDSGNPVDTTFVDRTVQRGFAYWYYVTAYDDGTQNWEDGKPLESGKYWNMMQKNVPVHPYYKPEQVKTLDKIRVVPNPYNYASRPINFPDEENKILFVGLPPKCTIKIFTVTGNLVRTLYHTSGTGEEPWDQLTENNQIVYSGVYVFTVESDIGNTTGKFVIVREGEQLE